MFAIVFWAALLIVVYTYLLYPVLIWFLTVARKTPDYAPLAEWPDLSLIIAAYNEEAVLRTKLENALALDYPDEKLDIIVVSDESSDDTDSIAAEFAERGVRLFRVGKRGGKTQAQNAGVELASGRFLVFSDANSMYAPDALKRLMAPFADGRIGCVCGELQYANPDDGGVGKGRGFGQDAWHGDQIGGVLDELACGPVVGMVVARSMRQHEVGAKGANLTNHAVAVLDGRLEMGVGQVPVDVFGSDQLACAGRFFLAQFS